jgi:hypothetical protein
VDLQRETFLPQGTLVLGGDADEVGRTVTLSNNEIYLGGTTFSLNFPVDGGVDTDFGTGAKEGFVARIVRMSGTSTPVMQWSSLVGGSGEDEVIALQGDSQGRLFIGGNTTSLDLVPPEVPSSSLPGTRPAGEAGGLFLMLVDPNAPSPDAGAGADAGVDAGMDAGVGAGMDAGVDAGMDDAGTDAGVDAGVDAGTPGQQSPLGWSCGASDSSGGPGALVLGSLVGLVLLASRRQRTTRSPGS